MVSETRRALVGAMLLGAAAAAACLAFTAPTPSVSFMGYHTRSSALVLVRSASRNSNCGGSRDVAPAPVRMSSDGGDAEHAHNERTLKDLLTVQACSSVQYYWQEFHDESSCGWLKDFESAGHNVAEVGWDGFLSALMRTEPETITIKKKVQRPRGGSGNNPFLSDNRHTVEYTVVMEPYEIAKKIMKVREQLVDEWMRDLQLLDNENQELLRHHDDLVLMDAEQADKLRQLFFYNDPLSQSRSPLFKQNYRELIALVTRVAIHRYKVELRRNGQRYHHNWLERFMAKKGEQLQGNALLEAMMEGPMTMINPKVLSQSDKLRVIEPMHIAMGVMRQRVQCASEFRRILASVADDHTQLMRAMLEHQLRATTAGMVAADHGDFAEAE